MRGLFACSLVASLASMAACSSASAPVNAAPARPKFATLDAAGTWISEACVDSSALPTHDTFDALVPDLFAQAGLPRPHDVGASCQWLLRLDAGAPTLSTTAALVWQGGAGDPDRFAVVSTVGAAENVRTVISAASERGAAFAVRRALELFVDRTSAIGEHVRSGELVDYAGFTRRGVIEGFYGPTFSPSDRIRLISLAAYLRENSYVYALKDADPFMHAQWRDPYDTTWGPIVRDAAAAARRNLVDFVWAASPGYYGGPEYLADAIHYGSDADFALLVTKTENVRALGVERFALFVDDVAPDFLWPDDAAQFPSLAAAQAFLMNRWDDYLMATGAPDHLWVVGDRKSVV